MMDDMNESEEPWDVDPIKLGNLFFPDYVKEYIFSVLVIIGDGACGKTCLLFRSV